MNQRFLLFLALIAVMMIPTSAAHASTSPASKYLHETVLPPGAADIGPSFIGSAYVDVGNAINNSGVVALHAWFGQECGSLHAFVYFPKSHRYVVPGDPPGLRTANTTTFGIADDNSVGVDAFSCSSKQTFMYRVTSVDTTPQWSQPCACRGYSPVGYNSDGAALNNRKLGPAVLSFPNGAPKISPLATHVGAPAKARVTAVGTPSGFVGTQHKPKARKDVPTVWLDGKPYRLPVARSSTGPPTPWAMDERQTAHGLRVDVVGTFYGGNDAEGVDYWQGKPTADGFTFTEKRRFVKSSDLVEAYGISTDGSMIFGDYYQDDDLIVYFTASHKERDFWGQCQNYGPGWGDSHGDVLVTGPGDHPGMCLAQPKH
jgi:hypothetical protein